MRSPVETKLLQLSSEIYDIGMAKSIKKNYQNCLLLLLLLKFIHHHCEIRISRIYSFF